MAHRHAGPPHPPIRTYLLIAAVLAVITAVEISVFYITWLVRFLVPILVVLSVAKFSLVVMFFMHLRFDSRVLSGLFVGPLVIAVSIVLALMALFGAFVVGRP
ncbi:MAG: cytochrome C oxidase subunit IV family protein [Candidatus Rokubacteria bacterium]|nr:cytochrome C oxidase subunit IV family protein [Candidatus Rokubacteria bacterium]